MRIWVKTRNHELSIMGRWVQTGVEAFGPDGGKRGVHTEVATDWFTQFFKILASNSNLSHLKDNEKQSFLRVSKWGSDLMWSNAPSSHHRNWVLSPCLCTSWGSDFQNPCVEVLEGMDPSLSMISWGELIGIDDTCASWGLLIGSSQELWRLHGHH